MRRQNKAEKFLESGRHNLIPDKEEGEEIEQYLDMLENGPLRGDEVQFHHGIEPTNSKSADLVDLMEDNYNVDMAENNREGDELAGDEHSSGFQGDEDGLPGHEEIEQENIVDEEQRKRSGDS